MEELLGRDSASNSRMVAGDLAGRGCRTSPGGGMAMNPAALSQLPLSSPLLTIFLQGAAGGALVGSAVLCRARRRGLHVEPWAITAAWSTLGALVAIVYMILVLAL